jgi:hypothetical protein
MRFILALACLTILLTVSLVAEQPILEKISRPPLQTRSSGYVFAGTVQSITPITPKEKNGVATMRITFRVDQAIQGIRTGQVLTIQEWAGVWEAGQKYRPGEKVVLFLYPPSRLGLTSVVQGPMGRFAVGEDGRVVIGQGRTSGLPPGLRARIGGRSRVDLGEFTRILRLEREAQP